MKRIADILPALDQREVLRGARAQRVLRSWPSIVGDLIARKSTPDRYDHGTVWIAAPESAWAQEIRLRSEDILQRLNDMAGEPGLFRELRVGAAGRRPGGMQPPCDASSNSGPSS